MTACMNRRVLFVVSGFEVGGAELQLLAYLRHAPRAFDIRVIGLTEEAGSPLFKRFQSVAACQIVPRLAIGPLEFLARLTREVRRLRPAILHSFQDGSPGTWGRLAARLANVPAIAHSDRCHHPPTLRSQRWLRPWLDRVTARFFSNAEPTAAWVRNMGVDERRIIVIPNGVDLDRFNPESTAPARRYWGIPANATIAGFLGKFRASEKRLDVLFDALLAIPESARPDFVVLGGDGPDALQIASHVRSSTWLREHVRFLGLVEDVPAFMAGIDYLVLSSDSEGQPNVVLEAMAMGKPVVSTAVSDVPAVIEGAGFTARPSDPASFAEALTKMQRLSNAQRAELGTAGRRRIEKKYDLRVTAARFWDAHDELCVAA
jgi:glycosyltransferase involved in cell wall biosynthesis